MLSWLWHSESQNPEELREELMTSTTRRIGVNLRHEHISTPRRQKGMEDELSRRIRLMQKIPGSDPHAIFVYNDRGFKSFTSEYKQILHWDMLARKPKAGSKYLDYTRDMLKREIEKAKSAVTTSKVATQEQPCDLLNEDFGQLKDDHDHLKEGHDQLREDYQQLREDQKRLREEHERMLSGWREQPEKTDKGRGKENSDTRNMRSHDDREMRILELEDPRSIPEAERRAREASDAREHQRFENTIKENQVVVLVPDMRTTFRSLLGAGPTWNDHHSTEKGLLCHHGQVFRKICLSVVHQDRQPHVLIQRYRQAQSEATSRPQAPPRSSLPRRSTYANQARMAGKAVRSVFTRRPDAM